MHCHAQLLLHELGGPGKHFAGWANSILIFCVANIQSVLYSVEKCTCSRHQALIISSYTLVPINHPKSLVKTPGQTVLLSHGGLTFSQPSMTPHFPWKPSSSLDILTFFSQTPMVFPDYEPYETWDSFCNVRRVCGQHQRLFNGSVRPSSTCPQP